MKSSKFYARILALGLVIITLTFGYVYIKLNSEKAHLPSRSLEEKEDKREPGEIRLGLEDKNIYDKEVPDISVIAVSKNRNYDFDKEALKKEADSKKTKSKKRVQNLSFTDKEKLEEEIERRNQILKSRGKADDENKEEKAIKEELNKKPIISDLREEKDVDIVIAEYSYLNKTKKQEEDRDKDEKIKAYFDNEKYKKDLSYINEGESWYKGGAPKSGDVKIENNKKLRYLEGYGWIDWSKITYGHSEVVEFKPSGILIGE